MFINQAHVAGPADWPPTIVVQKRCTSHVLSLSMVCSDEDEEPTTKSKGAAAADSKPKEVARQPSTDTSSLPLVD
jgi:hypothetical protein